LAVPPTPAAEAPQHTPLGTTIRFFLSSTFADFQIERDILQHHVFPELRRLCAASGYRLQPIDLRWGVSEAAGTDRQTLRVCLDELERCRRLSPDCFLLILLGERYGSYFLPPRVPAILVARLLPHLAHEERERFAAVYQLDDNAVPAEYVLLRADGPHDSQDEALRLAVVRAGQVAGMGADDRLLFEGSATHREIQLGLLGQPLETGQGAGVLCAVRTFAGDGVGPAATRFAAEDAARGEAVRRLTEAILNRLPADQVRRYKVALNGQREPVFDPEALAAVYLDLVRPKLEAVMAARSAAREAAVTQGRDDTALANAAFETERAAHVEGREAELAQIAAYLAGATGVGVPQVVTGLPGSGKSTLLAEAAVRARVAHPQATLVVRYVGVTPGTEHLVALLADLRRTLARASGQLEPAPLDDENALVSAVAAQLATLSLPTEQPLLLLVDALDQLADRTQRTDWLPPRLASSVRVVVSVLADRAELGYLSDRQPAPPVLRLAPLSHEAGRALLRNRLGAMPLRRLTPAQEEAVLAAFAPSGSPLHLSLLASEARRWRSFDPPQIGRGPLPQDTPALLRELLQRLEAPEHHGQALVGRSLGDLAAARFGLAEDELLDLLSRDTTVRQTQHDLSPMSPEIDPQLPLPTALWARLYAEVEPLLTEREADAGVRLFTFYHRQLRAAVEARYLAGADRAVRHQALADYFAGQPWRLGPAQWNWRKAVELVAQQEGAGSRTAAEQVLARLADELEQAPAIQADDPVGIARLIDALRDQIFTGGYWRVGERLYALQLAAVRARGDTAGEGRTLTRLGASARDLGRPEEAAHYLGQALALAREVGDRAGEATTLNTLGNMAGGLSRWEEAARYYEQALAIFREVGDRAGEGNALSNLGTPAAGLGRREEAVRYREQALALAREVGDRAGEGITLNNLGTLADSLGRPEQAARYYEQALVITREVGNRGAEGTILSNLGNLVYTRGRPEEAVRYYEQALAIRREVGDRAGEGITLNNLGLVVNNLGRYEEAVRYYEQALPIIAEVGNRGGEGIILSNLGDLARSLGRREEAVRYYEQALAIRREVGDRAGVGNALNNLGALARNLGRPEQAVRYYEQALAIFAEVGDRGGEGTTLNNLGALAAGLGRPEQAARYYEQALAITRATGDRTGAGTILNNLGALAAGLGRREEAARYYEQALATFVAIGAVDSARSVRTNLAAL
jgi:tetratricopeptide (TPR) repeat protein